MVLARKRIILVLALIVVCTYFSVIFFNHRSSISRLGYIHVSQVYVHSDEVVFNSDTYRQHQLALSKQAPLMNVGKAELSEQFHSLGSSPSNYLIYSAHYETRQHLIKFVGFAPMSHTLMAQLHDKVRCLIRNDTNHIESVQLTVYYHISTFKPWRGQLYDSYIFSCNYTINSITSVSLHFDESSATTITFPLITSETHRSYKFAVCVEPLVLSYSDCAAIKHFITVNTLFGAEHFYFYISEASDQVKTLLYSLPSVTTHMWPLDLLMHQTHAYGQKAASAHCLYNHREESEFLVFIDIDEILVPKESVSWSAMVEQLNSKHANLGAAVFQSKLFPRSRISQSQDTRSLPHTNLWSLEYTNTVGVFNLYQWSKVLVNTKRADVVDIHKVRQLFPGYDIINVTPSTAVVHHYRVYDSNMEMYEDRYMIKYQNDILKLYNSLLS